MDISNYKYLFMKRNSRSQPVHFYLAFCEDCGDNIEIRRSDLKKKDHIICIECKYKRSQTHGLSGTKLYRRWTSIKQRCYNPNRKDYKWYGAIGVTVCDEWLNSFEAFNDWSVKNNIEEFDFQIDKDMLNNGFIYSPENCIAVSRKKNLQNRSNSVNITLDDKTMNVSDWAKISPVTRFTIHNRLKKGWSERDAVFVGPYSNGGFV